MEKHLPKIRGDLKCSLELVKDLFMELTKANLVANVPWDSSKYYLKSKRFFVKCWGGRYLRYLSPHFSVRPAWATATYSGWSLQKKEGLGEKKQKKSLDQIF